MVDDISFIYINLIIISYRYSCLVPVGSCGFLAGVSVEAAGVSVEAAGVSVEAL
ncbi:hypothetical protein ACSAZK_04725 [Methanosarcina sp. Mfa9]|uniref:hypothetical protein n=1 Tax=Methanosarcina sp. Mfa9 TaxID=3439063 RepID=UPI003F85EB6C